MKKYRFSLNKKDHSIIDICIKSNPNFDAQIVGVGEFGSTYEGDKSSVFYRYSIGSGTIKPFDYDKIVKENTVVHCDTREKAKVLHQWADSVGLKWIGGDSYLGLDRWNTHKEDTCYRLLNGRFSNINYYKEIGYTIYEYQDVILDKNKCYGGFVKEYDFFSESSKLKWPAHITSNPSGKSYFHTMFMSNKQKVNDCPICKAKKEFEGELPKKYRDAFEECLIYGNHMHVSAIINEGDKKEMNTLNQYKFRGEINLNVIINDAIREGKRSFIIMGKKNAVVAVLGNTMEAINDIQSSIEYDNGEFISQEERYISPFIFKIIEKKQVNEWIKFLREERKSFNKKILKIKDKIRKKTAKGQNNGDEFKVFTIGE